MTTPGTTLRADRITETAEKLAQRIGERFPDSSLNQISHQLLELGQEAQANASRIARPIYTVRIAVGILIVLILIAIVALVQAVLSRAEQFSGVQVLDLMEGLEAGTNLFILFGLAIFFLVNLETRIKRARALRAIYELRSFAHVVDMHQLTKDPDYYRGGIIETRHSPKRELTLPQLTRYLDYCSETLSITSKIAALYVQQFSDGVVLAAVSDVETLCDGLSRKIWQKMNIAEDINSRQATVVT